MHSVFINFPIFVFFFFVFQLLPDQTGSGNLLSLQKGRNGEEGENKSCLLLL